MHPVRKGAVIAAAAAALFTNGALLAQASDKTGGDVVKCSGVNACKGQGACTGASACGGANGCKGASSCKGQNACKGKGWVEKSAAECTKLGGTVVAADGK